MKTLIEKLRQYAAGDDFQRATEQAADAIECMELEAVAATLRIENDAREIEGWRADQKENLKNQCDLVAERDEWKERCEFSFKERDKLLATNASLVRDKESDRLAYLAVRAERDALKLDAGRCKWLQANHKSWSWNPSQYAAETTSGFAALGTGYLGYGFTDAVDAARQEFEINELRAELDTQTKAANHWMADSCRNHNELAKLKQQEPVAWVNCRGKAPMFRFAKPTECMGTVVDHWEPVYLDAGRQTIKETK